jgi:hypothetical protein
MWATRKATKNIKYSYVDDEDKENLVARSSDDKSEGSEIPYGLAPARHSRRPYITGNTTGIVILLLVYGLSILAAIFGTGAVLNRGNNLLKKTSAYCKSPLALCVEMPC